MVTEAIRKGRGIIKVQFGKSSEQLSTVRSGKNGHMAQ